MPGDSRQVYGWNDVATPDAAAIDAHIKRADFILVRHTHYDHVLDVPHIALKTYATVIGTESTENVARAYNVPEEQLITVRGGEDCEFGVFSIKVIPSLHSALDHKRYFSSEKAREGMKAPLTLLQIHPEGGTLAYLLRFHGSQILVFGGMNYIEREMEGIRPDVVLVGAGSSRREIHDYTGRLELSSVGAADSLGQFPGPLWSDPAACHRSSAILRGGSQSGFAKEQGDCAQVL